MFVSWSVRLVSPHKGNLSVRLVSPPLNLVSLSVQCPPSKFDLSFRLESSSKFKNKIFCK